MDITQPIISVAEAREILGSVALKMSDDEILETITTLDMMAKDALTLAKQQLEVKRDTHLLAELIYDIYQDKKAKS